jgi:hypothetical protein
MRHCRRDGPCWMPLAVEHVVGLTADLCRLVHHPLRPWRRIECKQSLKVTVASAQADAPVAQVDGGL